MGTSEFSASSETDSGPAKLGQNLEDMSKRTAKRDALCLSGQQFRHVAMLVFFHILLFNMQLIILFLTLETFGVTVYDTITTYWAGGFL